MQHMSFRKFPVNLAALDETLRDQIGSVYVGVSRTPQQVHVYLDTEAGDDQRAQVEQVIADHDAAQVSQRQQRRYRRRQALAQARMARGLELDMSDYDFSDGIIRQLARKVAWLELELLDLRED
jgi:hypothetical protein